MSEVSTDVITGNNVLTAREQVEGLNMGRKTIYSTINAVTLAQKMDVLRMLTEAEPVRDHLEEPIAMKHLLAQVVEVAQADGSMVEAIRTIVLAEDGKAYATVSSGVFKAIQNIMEVLGDPKDWGNAAIPIQFVEKKSRRGYDFITVTTA